MGAERALSRWPREVDAAHVARVRGAVPVADALVVRRVAAVEKQAVASRIEATETKPRMAETMTNGRGAHNGGAEALRARTRRNSTSL